MAFNRFGLPLVVTKAASIQSLQRATTIGSSKGHSALFSSLAPSRRVLLGWIF
jgi:hypothetical protein